jgi:hypothetical protein
VAHFHCWELSTSGSKSDSFILNGEAVGQLGSHDSCDKCCECTGGRYVMSTRREIVNKSPDIKQIPICARCNGPIIIGEFCGTSIIIGKAYFNEFNLCAPCRKLAADLIKDFLVPEKEKKYRERNTHRRNIII